MKKVLALFILIATVFSLSSCIAFWPSLPNDGSTESETPSLTQQDVQNMIDNSMKGEITVQGGDNNYITIENAQGNTLTASKALLSSVSVICTNAAGSGVIYKLDKERGDAYVITNYHVVYDEKSANANKISTSINCLLYGQEFIDYAIPATYVGGSMQYDIAILKVSGSKVLAESNAMAVEFADSDEVSVFETAIAIGNAQGEGISVTGGVVTVDSESLSMQAADNSMVIEMRVMRTDAAVNSGNSGGGLFNSQGQLIGIVNAKVISNTVEGMGYAIPSNVVKYVSDNILYYCDGKAAENPYRCMLGITVYGMKYYTVYDQTTGKLLKREIVQIQSLTDTSIVKGKLYEGDIIQYIKIHGNTYAVHRMHNVVDIMLNARVGDTVTFGIMRGNEKLVVEVKITQASLTIWK